MQTVTVVRSVDDESHDQILPRFSCTRDAGLAQSFRQPQFV
jgi:hypothetical protein